MARRRRPGRGCGRRRPARAGRGRLGAAAWARRSSEALAWRAPQACAAGPDEAMGPSFAGVPAAAAPANSGGAGEGAPAAADPDASLADASARFPGSGEERRFGSDGPGAWGAADRRPAPSGRAGGRRRRPNGRFARRFPTPRRSSSAPSSAFRSRPGALRAGFVGVFHRRRARSESCPIRQAYRTSPPHDKRGG